MSTISESTVVESPSSTILTHAPVGLDERTRFENVHTVLFDQASSASKSVALEIAELIREKASKNEHCILGLATGSSPISVYDELVRMHREEGLSFKNVITFNLDEYFPMQPNSLQSYRRFMNEYLFDHVDIDPKNIHIPDGTLSMDQVEQYCETYEKRID